MQIVTALVEILISGLTTYAGGIGGALNSMITSAFVVTDSTTHAITGLSVFGQTVAAFGSIALGVGITTLVVKYLMSWGSRK